MYIKDMKRFIRENMNSYMFNKVRMMAVACGIAIVSGNICGICDKSGTPPADSGSGSGPITGNTTVKYDKSNHAFVSAVASISLEDLLGPTVMSQ